MTADIAVMVLMTSAYGFFLAETAAPDSLGSISRLGVEAVLITGIGVLWKAFVKKDDQMMEMVKKFTESIEQVTAAVKNNSEALEANTDIVRSVKSICDVCSRTVIMGQGDRT